MERPAAWPRLFAAAMLTTLAGCGGSDPIVQPTPSPTPCSQTTVDNASEPIDSKTLIYFDLSVPDSGRLDVTLDWTFPTSGMGFYLVPANTCSLAEFNARSCNFLIRSEPSSTKPKKISTPNFNAGNYRWIVANFATVTESYSLLVVLSKGPCAALSGFPADATALTPDAAGSAERMIRR